MINCTSSKKGVFGDNTLRRTRGSLLFLDQTEARRAKNIFLETWHQPYLRVCVVILIPKHSFCNNVCVCMVMQVKLVVDRPYPSPPYLNIWIRHCNMGICS